MQIGAEIPYVAGSADEVDLQVPPTIFCCGCSQAYSAGTIVHVRWALTVEGIARRWR